MDTHLQGSAREAQDLAIEQAGQGKRREAPGRPFTSETAREAALAGAEKARERKAARELDRLTAVARAGVAAAQELDYETQRAILRAMTKEAKQGKVPAARFLMDWLVKLGESTSDDDADQGGEDITPAQRAARRAELLRMIEESEAKDPA